jgi:hypothetical protein
MMRSSEAVEDVGDGRGVDDVLDDDDEEILERRSRLIFGVVAVMGVSWMDRGRSIGISGLSKPWRRVEPLKETGGEIIAFFSVWVMLDIVDHGLLRGFFCSIGEWVEATGADSLRWWVGFVGLLMSIGLFGRMGTMTLVGSPGTVLCW